MRHAKLAELLSFSLSGVDATQNRAEVGHFDFTTGGAGAIRNLEPIVKSAVQIQRLYLTDTPTWKWFNACWRILGNA